MFASIKTLTNQPGNLPLVTVVTPSFNQANFLEYTLRSVLAQDYPAIEYLVVDGGSTDGSVETLRTYADRLAWWVSEPDQGQASAIAKGFARAHGEIIAWLNSDDLYLPGAIRAAVRGLQARPDAGMIYGNAITIDAQGRPLNRLDFTDYNLIDLMSFRIICQPSVFMRRRIYEQVGGIDPAYHFMLDHHLWIRMAKTAPIVHISETWSAARHHQSAKNASQAAGFSGEILLSLKWMESSPQLKPLVEKNRRKILGGAYRLHARYLLEGGLPGPALQSYFRSLIYRPGYALQHWHRMLFAAAGLVGLQGAAWQLAAQRKNPRLVSHFDPGWKSWPGLQINEGR
ncbi:MAG TPA: glycosyltransferase family 2 protein [Anaerolineales bacterium]|jgi:glycosyltransferase involved in cell wall biosynthesis|nr:glycosyltransferase family 2 protein [Anaerolineales bacterium]